MHILSNINFNVKLRYKKARFIFTYHEKDTNTVNKCESYKIFDKHSK